MKLLTRQMVEPAQVHPTLDNTRTIDFDDPKLLELAASLYHDGQLQECVCRPHPAAAGMLDLRAGERRWLAAIMADVPLQVAVYEMTDDEALRITVLENLHREELHPLDEAEAIGKLFARGWTAEQVAAEVAKSPVWVSRRARLCALIPAWRKAVYGENARLAGWGVAHLELIARYEPAEQQALLQQYQHGSHLTARDLQQYLARRMRTLKAATFDLANAELPGGACTACPKRSSCNPLLFPEMESKDDDLCLDAACWKQKQEAWLELEIRVKRAQYPNLVLVGYGTSRKDVLATWDVERVKKSAAGAVPALLVDEGEAGKLVWVKPKQDRPGAAKQVAKAQGPAEQLAAKREQLWRRRAAWCFEQLFARLNEPPGWLQPGCDLKLIRLLAVWGTGSAHGGVQFWDDDGQTFHHSPVYSPAADVLLAKLEPADLHLVAWRQVAKSIEVNWHIFNTVASNLTRHDEAEQRLGYLAELLEVDFDQLWRKAEATKPEPKSWRKLAKAAEQAPAEGKAAAAPTEAEDEDGEDADEDDFADEDDAIPPEDVRSCRICGCTDDAGCLQADGEVCHWVAEDLCSACAANEEDDQPCRHAPADGEDGGDGNDGNAGEQAGEGGGR